MQIVFLVVGKTNDKYLMDGIAEYEKRLKRYIPFKPEVIPEIKRNKGLAENELKTKEGNEILGKLQNGDFVVLLDENGKSFGSVAFAKHLQKRMNGGYKRIVFVVGGPYGFSPEVYNRANEKLSLSAMTFSHQMVRLFFTEQIYRAFTILRNEPYHHQ
jgi:23S rRNA (pseudouridine1915-N3)-methyltransferase